VFNEAQRSKEVRRHAWELQKTESSL